MSRLARPASGSDEAGTLSHARIWEALDALAVRYGMSPSGLAKRAGLDATTFNRSKRRTNDGRLRWPSTESISKVLDATGASLGEFLQLTEGTDVGAGRSALPKIALSQLDDASDLFDEEGLPKGSGWGDFAFPNLLDEHAYAIEVLGESLSPTYRDRDLIVVSPAAPIRRGDRVIVKTLQGPPIIGELMRRAGRTIELRSLDSSASDRTLNAEDVAWLKRIVWCSQ
jgi:phage repressor protein C with HTH and peptisase S24 domain